MTAFWTESPLEHAIRKLRRMVALSAAFQTRAAIDYDTALTRVWVEYVPNVDELNKEQGSVKAVNPPSPFAAIWPMSTGMNPIAGGQQVWSIPEGMLHLYIACGPLPSLHDWNDRRLEAIGFLDQWMVDITNLSGADDPDTEDDTGHLTISKGGAVVIDHTPFKDRTPENEKYFQSIGLKYGDDA